MENIKLTSSTANLFIIVIDGFRWQEVFNGPDINLLTNKSFTPDPAAIAQFWNESREIRRRQLLPFFWNVISKSGLLFGDRNIDSRVNATNIYSMSYPGYNEMLTGKANFWIMGNKKKFNRNINVLEWLSSNTAFNGNIAVFSSWNGLPYVLNKNRNGLMIDGGFEKTIDDKIFLAKNPKQHNKKRDGRSPETRFDAITYERAKEYIPSHHPRVTVIVFGEGDIHAHEKRYDLYLKEANKADSRIAELWNFVQSDPLYKNNTNFLITTDHGRGSGRNNWHKHGFLVKGSSQTWLALLGPHIELLKLEKRQIYNKELAGIIARLVGEEFSV